MQYSPLYYANDMENSFLENILKSLPAHGWDSVLVCECFAELYPYSFTLFECHYIGTAPNV